MSTMQKMLYTLVVFYTVVGVAYTVWTANYETGIEWVGVVTLFLMAVFTAFVGFYMGVERKPFKRNPLPEDCLDAEIADADAELGFFSPWSWWPFILAVVIGVALIGVSVGWWIVLFAFPLVIVALVGWVFEYYRGRFQH